MRKHDALAIEALVSWRLVTATATSQFGGIGTGSLLHDVGDVEVLCRKSGYSKKVILYI